MSKKTIAVPEPGVPVLFDACHLLHGVLKYVVPAIVHRVIEGDLVLLWAVDDDGETLRALGGALPSVRFGELRPGVPAPECWCYPPARSTEQLEVEIADEEPTFTP